VHSETLLADEVSEVGGIVVTSPARTAFDIGRRVRSRLRAVQQLDALAHATDVKDVDVEAIMSRHLGARGVVRFRRVLPLVDGGAESPQETRTRLAQIPTGDVHLPCRRCNANSRMALMTASVNDATPDRRVV
jgi:hypothetical protein